MQELKWALYRKPGGVVQAVITSCQKDPSQIPNAFVYEKKFKRMLEPFKPFTRLDVIVSSPGGAVNSAFGMLKAIYDSHRPVRVLMDGYCGSSATFFVSAADKGQCFITSGGSMYVHMPKLYGREKLSGIWKLLDAQQQLSVVNGMICMYRAKLHWPRREIRLMIKESRRFTAKEAVDVGFADAIMERREFESYA